MNPIYSLFVLLSTVVLANSLQCYLCNSLSVAECENSFEKFLKPCPVKSFGGRKAVQPVGCRVTRQYVKEEYSVVRECAYSGEDVVGKSSKGSSGVSRIMSQCSKDACNPASQVSYAPLAVIIPLLAKLIL